MSEPRASKVWECCTGFWGFTIILGGKGHVFLFPPRVLHGFVHPGKSLRHLRWMQNRRHCDTRYHTLYCQCHCAAAARSHSRASPRRRHDIVQPKEMYRNGACLCNPGSSMVANECQLCKHGAPPPLPWPTSASCASTVRLPRLCPAAVGQEQQSMPITRLKDCSKTLCRHWRWDWRFRLRLDSAQSRTLNAN